MSKLCDLNWFVAGLCPSLSFQKVCSIALLNLWCPSNYLVSVIPLLYVYQSPQHLGFLFFPADGCCIRWYIQNLHRWFLNIQTMNKLHSQTNKNSKLRSRLSNFKHSLSFVKQSFFHTEDAAPSFPWYLESNRLGRFRSWCWTYSAPIFLALVMTWVLFHPEPKPVSAQHSFGHSYWLSGVFVCWFIRGAPSSAWWLGKHR